MPTKPIDISKAKCTKLSFDSAVNFLRSSENKELTGFDIEAYTGAVVDRWWGKLVVAVDGISAKQQMPIFRNHDHMEIVGYSTSATVDGVFSVQGVFSSATEAAKEVKELAKEGFPWQASIGVEPKVIVEIRENASMVVNGQDVQGPAEVWLESEVFETSFVALGADSNTGVTVFSEERQRAEPPTTQPTSVKEHIMDLATLKKEHPGLVVELSAEIVAGLQMDDLQQNNSALVASLLAQGSANERARIEDVRAQLIPGHESLVAQLELDGTSTGAEAAKAIVAAERELRKQAGENLQQQSNPVVPPGGDPNGDDGKQTIKRSAFNAASPARKAELIKLGTKIVD